MKWEYKTIKYHTKGFLGGKVDESQLTSEMNELGAMGWELVSALSTNAAYGESRDVIAFFKRPLD